MRKTLLAMAVLSLSSAVFSVANAAPYVVPSKWFAGDPDAVKPGGVLRESKLPPEETASTLRG